MNLSLHDTYVTKYIELCVPVYMLPSYRQRLCKHSHYLQSFFICNVRCLYAERKEFCAFAISKYNYKLLGKDGLNKKIQHPQNQ